MAIDLQKIQAPRQRPKEPSKPARGNRVMELLNRDIALGKAFGDKKKERFYSDLYTLFMAGVDLRSALDLLAEEQTSKKDRALMEHIRQQVVGGLSFCEALKSAKHFGPYEYYSIQIGEETGKLPDILKELAAYFARRIQLRRQLVKVLTYPAFVLSVSFGVIYFMLKHIVPMFSDVFQRFGSELPEVTKKVIVFSEAFTAFFPFLLAAFIALSVLIYLQRNQIWLRKLSAALMMRIPFFGPLVRKVYLARFCQSMQLLVASRTSLIEATELVEKMIRFYPIESSLPVIRENLVKGKSLHGSLQQFRIYDRKMVSLIKVAEEVNQLDAMFDKLGKQYSEEVEHRTATVGSVIEPAMIIVIGLLVGFILVAMYLPLFNLGNTIQ